jgi:hypothetical protein
VEVIGHQAIRKHPTARELFTEPHDHPEMLPFRHVQQKAPTIDPADAVVERRFRRRVLPSSHPSPAIVHAHDAANNTHPPRSHKKNPIESLAFYGSLSINKKRLKSQAFYW